MVEEQTKLNEQPKEKANYKFKPVDVVGKIFLSKSGKSLNLCNVVPSDEDYRYDTKLIPIGFAPIKDIERLMKKEIKAVNILKIIER